MGDLLILNQLTQCIRELHRTGHSPATSTNYSCRDGNGKMWITRSGIDKSLMQYEDFIEISPEGTPLPPFETVPPSAETGIHCAIYHMFPDTQVILHSHDIHALVQTVGLSRKVFEGYELQKAFRGVVTHEGEISIPIIPNSQDMNVIKNALLERKSELNYGVFMIEKHGYYTWGNSIFEAKRLMEAFAYLCHAERLLNP